MSKTKILLALDPSSTCTGWAVFHRNARAGIKLHRYGRVKASKRLSVPERVESMVIDLGVVIMKESPDCAFIERPGKANYFNKQGQRTSSGTDTLYHAWACIYAMLAEHLGLYNVYGVRPQSWKGNGSKLATIETVNLAYGLSLTLTENDMADAVYMGGWFLERQKIDPIKPLVRCDL